MVSETLAATQPTSRPVAAKVTGAETLDTESVEKEIPPIVVLGGSASNTEDGTVNVSAEVGAWQVKRLATKSVVLPPMDPTERPVMLTEVLGSPPVQFTLTPFDRVTVEMLLLFDHTSGAAIWR